MPGNPAIKLSKISEFAYRPAPRIENRITKRLKENGLQQVIKLCYGFTAFGAQRTGLVQNRRDAALLCDSR